jgi:hypothetical protein
MSIRDAMNDGVLDRVRQVVRDMGYSKSDQEIIIELRQIRVNAKAILDLIANNIPASDAQP